MWMMPAPRSASRTPFTPADRPDQSKQQEDSCLYGRLSSCLNLRFYAEERPNGGTTTAFCSEMKNICKVLPRRQGARQCFADGKARHGACADGENRAGKSTLMKCLFGIYSKDSGQILLNGKGSQLQKPRKRRWNTASPWCIRSSTRRSSAMLWNNIWLGRYPTVGPFTSEKDARRYGGDFYVIWASTCGLAHHYEHDARGPAPDGGDCQSCLVPFRRHRVRQSPPPRLPRRKWSICSASSICCGTAAAASFIFPTRWREILRISDEVIRHARWRVGHQQSRRRK